MNSRRNTLSAPTTISPNSNLPLYLRMSYRCLAYELAQHNNVGILFRFDGKANDSDHRHFSYHLSIGHEDYYASGSNKRKAQEAVAELALNRTRFPKPPQGEKVCVYSKTAIDLVHEWTQRYHRTVVYHLEDVKPGPPRSYVMDCYIAPNLTTRAEALDRQAAKLAAADKMLAMLKTVNTEMLGTDEGVEQKHPVSRLYELQALRHDIDPVFKMKGSVDTFDQEDRKISQFIMEVRVGHLVADGVGTTVKAAKREACKKMLQMMNQPV